MVKIGEQGPLKQTRKMYRITQLHIGLHIITLAGTYNTIKYIPELSKKALNSLESLPEGSNKP